MLQDGGSATGPQRRNNWIEKRPKNSVSRGATRACSGSEDFEDSSTNPSPPLETAHEFPRAENRFEISDFCNREAVIEIDMR
jgi:hypothetical protein